MNDEGFKARLPRELKEWLIRRASHTHRSANKELVALLDEARRRYDGIATLDENLPAKRSSSSKKALG